MYNKPRYSIGVYNSTMYKQQIIVTNRLITFRKQNKTH